MPSLDKHKAIGIIFEAWRIAIDDFLQSRLHKLFDGDGGAHSDNDLLIVHFYENEWPNACPQTNNKKQEWFCLKKWTKVA